MHGLLACVLALACVWHCAKAAEPVTTVSSSSAREAALSSSAPLDSALASTLLAGNTVRISDSQITFDAQDKTALLKAIADAVLARRVGLRSDVGTNTDTGSSNNDSNSSGGGGDGDSDPGATRRAAPARAAAVHLPIVALFPVSRSAFLYYAPDPTDATKLTVRLGWRYALADWKLYRALIAPSACEVQRVIGAYYYC